MTQKEIIQQIPVDQGSLGHFVPSYSALSSGDSALSSASVSGKDRLAFLTNGLGWAGLAFFQDKRAGLGWAGAGWSSVEKERARRFSLTLTDIL